MCEQTLTLYDKLCTYCKIFSSNCCGINDIQDIFLVLGVLLLVFSIIPFIFRQKLISSQNATLRLWGENRSLWYPFLISTIIILLSSLNWGQNDFSPNIIWPTILFITLLLIIISCIKAKRILNKNKNNIYDAYNHYIQLIILASVGFSIITIACIFKLNNSENFIPFTIFAALLSWIFQDSIQGIVAYFHLRSNGLLHIGDWIQIPELNIDGVISDFSLVTVTVKNWDTTTSNVAIYKLQTNSFKNNQEMLDGKTDGRRMYRSFIIDSRSIATLNDSQIKNLDNKLKQCGQDTFFLQQINSSETDSLNLNLYRLYLRNWLANHSKISLSPRLLVRIMEPNPEGIPIQIYAYITKYNLYEFELIQSEITEHAILSMSWFGLRLYQKPSSKDFSDFIKFENKIISNNEEI